MGSVGSERRSSLRISTGAEEARDSVGDIPRTRPGFRSVALEHPNPVGVFAGRAAGWLEAGAEAARFQTEGAALNC